MAIIQGLQGLEVTIFTDGRTAKEYDDPSGKGGSHQPSRVVTKYIECKDNEPFRIRIKATDEYSWGFKDHVLTFGAVIDGIWAKGELCRQEYTEEEDWEREISYRVVKNPDNYARYVLQEFAFSSIIKTDDAMDEHYESDLDKMERLGVIEVRVNRATVGGNGPVFVPCGKHPKGFTISREAVEGKTKSHGTKFTRTQPAVKPTYIRCSALKEDDGPIAIFRFKYRSPGALILEGVTPDPQQSFDWLVEISDDENNKRSNPGWNQQNAFSNSIRPYFARFTSSHNSELKPAEPPQQKRSVLSNIEFSRPGTQKATSTHNSSEVKRFNHRVLDPRCRPVRKEFAHNRNNLKRKNSVDGQARLSAASQHKAPQFIANPGPQPKIQMNSGPWAKQEASGSTKGNSLAGKRTHDKTDRQDKYGNNGATLLQGTETTLGPRSCDLVLPSIEHVDNMKVKETKSKKKTTATQHTGKTIDLNKKNPISAPSVMKVIEDSHHGLGASSSTAQSPKSPTKTKDEHRKLTKPSQSKPSEPKLTKDQQEREIQPSREPKARLEKHPYHRDDPSSVTVPHVSFPLPLTPILSSASLPKSMLSLPPPSLSTKTSAPTSSYIKPKIPWRIFPTPIGYTHPNKAGTGLATTNTSSPNSASKPILDSRTTNADVNTGAVTHTDKETKTAPKTTTKRKASEIVGTISNRPVHDPCPPKKPKTRDEREIIEIYDSDELDESDRAIGWAFE